jgi:hypothetical protein
LFDFFGENGLVALGQKSLLIKKRRTRTWGMMSV